MSRRALKSVVGVAAVLLLGSRSEAQIASHWEFEVHGGVSGGSTSTDGAISQAPAAELFTTLTGRTSKRVSTWFLGEGTTFFNTANAALSASAGRITALDPALAGEAAKATSGGTFGFRVGYAVTPRLTAEFSVDAATRSKWSDAAIDAVEATRASFISGWNGLISTGDGVVFTNPTVTSTADVDQKGARPWLVTGALTYGFPMRGRVTPFVTAGGGIRTSSDGPEIALTGNYRFTSLNAIALQPFVVNETDRLTVRAESGSALAVLFGGGVKIARSPKWGIRAEARAHVIRNTTDLLIAATPSVETSSPVGAIASTTSSSLQFSSNPARGFRSSLSGPALSEVRVFKGSGSDVSVTATVGVYFRF